MHVFRPSQDSSVWLGLTSTEQLMSPEFPKHQVLSFTKMLVVWWSNKRFSVLISVLQSNQCSVFSVLQSAQTYGNKLLKKINTFNHKVKK